MWRFRKRATYWAGFVTDFYNFGNPALHTLPASLTYLCEKLVIRFVTRRDFAGKVSEGLQGATTTWKDALDNDDKREALAAWIVSEGLSVRAVEEIVALGESEPAVRQPRHARRLVPRVAAPEHEHRRPLARRHRRHRGIGDRLPAEVLVRSGAPFLDS